MGPATLRVNKAKKRFRDGAAPDHRPLIRDHQLPPFGSQYTTSPCISAPALAIASRPYIPIPSLSLFDGTRPVESAR